MRRARFALPILGSTALLLGVTGVQATAQPAPAETPAPSALPRMLTPADEVPVLAAADEAEKITAKYPNSSAGAHWDAEAKVLYINLVQPKAKQADHRVELQSAISTRLTSAKLGVTTKYRSVPLSLDEQNAFLDRFLKERAQWGGKAAVDSVVSGSVDELTGRIHAIALTGAAELQVAARKYFGNTVDIRTGGAPQAQSRYSSGDSPYPAGIPLWEQGGGNAVGTAQCTAGFGWSRHSDGLRYVSTAGHCAPSDTSIFGVNVNQRIGYIGTRYLNNYEYVDFAFVKLTLGNAGPLGRVWVGGVDTDDLRNITSVDPGTVTGTTVCSSGAATGLVCGRINNRVTAAAVNGVTIERLTCVTSAQRTQQGDSGAPWVTTPDSQSARAWGQHVGTAYCDNSGDNTVDMVFSTVQNIAARVGATLILFGA
jgi:hypothetical protein